MLNTILPCRRICCVRNPNRRLVNKKLSPNKSNSNKIPFSLSSENEKISNNFSQSNQLINSHINIPSNDKIISIPNQLYKIQSDIDLDRLTKEYLESINEYRFHLGFSSLELSNELNNRALHQATQLCIQNYIENTDQFDLIYNNEPIGETVMSCRAPVNNGYDIAQWIHDQLMIDLKNGSSSKKRYTPILNPDCQFLGFGLVRNEEKTKDFIVIYYYPIKKSDNSITK